MNTDSGYIKQMLVICRSIPFGYAWKSDKAELRAWANKFPLSATCGIEFLLEAGYIYSATQAIRAADYDKGEQAGIASPGHYSPGW